MSECAHPEPDRPSGLDALAERAAARNVPFQALLELTGRCNLDCAHCYLDIRNPPKHELSTEEWIDVLDALRDAGTLFLTLTGGEVFLRKDLFEILRAARDRRFSVRLFTTGTLMGRREVEQIAELKPEAVEISVYGLRSETHDRITRRKRSLRKSLRAAVMLRNAGVPVMIKSPIIAGNDDGHWELIDAARRLGAGFAIDPSIISRRDGGTEPLKLRPDRERVRDLYADPRISPGGMPVLRGPLRPSDAPCAIARRVVRIGPSGDVYACGVFPIAAGNVRQQSFASIWSSSPVLEKLRNITVGDLRGACNGCARSGYCGRCSSQALLEHGDFRGPSVEACERAEALERAAGVEPPHGANAFTREQAGDHAGRRSQRDLAESLVPAERLLGHRVV